MKNKSLLMTVAILIIGSYSVAQVKGTFTDNRDSKIYKTVKIGTQIWMAENLQFKATKGCWAYNDSAVYAAKFGYLYNWETAMKVCPVGWHLPSSKEWKTLIDFLIANGYNYDNSKSENLLAKAIAGITNWPSSTEVGAVGNTDYPAKRNASGFSALPSGYRLDKGGVGAFLFGKGQSSWWSSSEIDDTYWWCWSIIFDSNFMFSSGNNYDGTAYSVRCIKD